MKVLVFVVGLLTSLSGLAQTGLPPMYEINRDTTYYAVDSAHFQLLDDHTGKLTIDQVSQPALSGRFYYGTSRPKTGNASVCWLRIRIRNNLPSGVELLYSGYGSDYADFYSATDATHWLHQRGGNLRPNSERTLHGGVRIQSRFAVGLQPGEAKWLYLRAETVFWHPRQSYFSPEFISERARTETYFRSFLTDTWKDYLFDGMMLGILALAAISNVLIFISIRDRTYLYFGICLIFIGLDRNTGVVQRAFFPEHPYLFSLAANFFFIIYFVFFIQSIRTFLNPPASLHTLNRIITVALLVTVPLTIYHLIGYAIPDFPEIPMNLASEISIRIVYILVFIMNVRMIQKGSGQARFSLVATLPLFMLWLSSLASNVNYYLFHSDNTLFDLPDYLENGCFAWLIIFFLGALVGRYNQVSKQVSQQVLEREQLERERAEERNRLIADQNEQLERQVAERTAELQTSLDTLKTTQAQLIQSEKMASLGELTAGIAHEIQNPLNFVNNFADVSAELVSELEEERQKPTRNPDLEADLLSDLKQNLVRIGQHGNRASGIVRSMLEHSRTATGQKEMTDLNALCNEYLRLAYHGLRAKDKTITCELITHFDARPGLIEVVPQDIGRVILNLVNNAFYAVQERQRTAPATYQPTVTVWTKQADLSVTISIRDNGTGMTDAVKQKIFQPFFTTKPTGSGTGLGLSLSYDIVVKGHGGTLTVDSRVGEGTEFTVTLPAA